jgi:hypothetical protein
MREARAVVAVALAVTVAAAVPIVEPAARADDAASAATPPDGTRTYGVYRNGSELGSHVITFRHTEAGFVVEHHVRIRVKILFVTAYHYEADRTETWRDGRLVAVRTTTNDNGTTFEVTTKPAGDGLEVHGSAGTSTVAADVGVPGPAWNTFASHPTKLVDPDSGKILTVNVTGPVDDVLTVAGGKALKCKRVRVTGGFDATIWFGADGLMLEERMKARDGSTVETVLR